MASKGNELTGTARPTHLRIFVLLMLFLILTSSVAFTYFQAGKNSERFTADAVLSVLRADPQTQVVGFGEPLKIRVVIQNNGQAPVTLAPGTLVLDSTGCSFWPGFSSGMELDIPLVSDGDPQSPIVLTAGGYVTLTGVSMGVTVLALGVWRPTSAFAARMRDLVNFCPRRQTSRWASKWLRRNLSPRFGRHAAQTTTSAYNPVCGTF